ncbi:GNAT family N-acetyltransferase [Reyranella sp.]|uniref:GNAT family N-acetyltransferase n=1 Tax=Reyranella sp. TaxID=1929291 RepID=UPI002724E3E7|nr:GNAT family N-acetyltransferase [Reyranella sp.]MDO8976946.1 GNAT family N-acetyltransferase [Reyranella sp.]MDP3242381.1 GNAT family N-acetyltransferase [Reyranella sp.]
MSGLIVRDAEPSDRSAWGRMWTANYIHHGATMGDAEVGELWRRILHPDHPVCALVSAAANDRDLLGFAHYVLHPHTFTSRTVCYLEDLWVEPAARGTGVGRRLIEALIERGRAHGWRRLYWHTEADNAPARRLYDRMSTLTDYIRYDVDLT